MTVSRATGSPAGLVLGTVQLGMAYGIANRTGRPDADAARAILDRAARGGVAALDTARAYGEAEAVIGTWLAATVHPLPVITKLAPLASLGLADRAEAARASLALSRQALGLQRLGLVLAHREEDLLDPTVRDVLEAEKARGGIAAWGVSATRLPLLERVLEVCTPAGLQVPASIADRRYLPLAAAARAGGAAVFARSPFLQGALLMETERLPAHLAPLRPGLAALDRACAASGCGRAALLLAVQRAEPALDGVVFGVETPAQLEDLLATPVAEPLVFALGRDLRDAFAGLPDEILDPGRWPR